MLQYAGMDLKQAVYNIFIRYPILAHDITWCYIGNKVWQQLSESNNLQK